MKHHDQKTYFLFGAVAIALGGYLLYELLSRIYLQLFGPTIDGMLFLGFVFSIWAAVGISTRQKRLEISLAKSVEDKLTEFERPDSKRHERASEEMEASFGPGGFKAPPPGHRIP